MTAIGTAYSVRDASGRILCHAPSQVKANLDSRRKRAVREGFALMCTAAGLALTTCGHDIDPVSLSCPVPGCSGAGTVQDVVTGAWLPMADGDTRRDDMAVIERGHVVPDEANGAMCPCNLVPENRGSNKGHGKRSMDPRTFRATDPRAVWFDVWFAHYARPSQRRAAIRP